MIAQQAHEPGEGRRIGKLVGAIALVAVAAGVLWYSARKTTTTPKPRERTAADFIVAWECDKGHRTEAPGAPGARPCPTCGGESFATFTCSCTDGACGNTATMQLRYDEQSLPDDMRWRPKGDWIKYEFPPKCPKCGHDMRPG
ncbi:MAG: hypothetical protein HZB38_06390 [Planctomycetes bacterium]|nr:hypothetical protein [Planctomycetota bacterium]